MRNLKFVRSWALPLTLILWGLSQGAYAWDSVKHAHDCMPSGYAYFDRIDWDPEGITNVSETGDIWVYCSTDRRYSGQDDMEAFVYFANNNDVAADVYCVYRNIHDQASTGLVASASATYNIAANSRGGGNLDIAAEGNPLVATSLTCRLPPGTSMVHIWWEEGDA